MMTRTLHFERDHDVSRVSGPGRVALAVEWPDGSYHCWWYPAEEEGGLGTHGWMPNAGKLLGVHGHDGATRFVYDDTGEELTAPQGGWTSGPDAEDIPPVKQGWNFPEDLLEAAWGLIANANHGDWYDATPGWREAAERWRDAYTETLDAAEEPQRVVIEGQGPVPTIEEYEQELVSDGYVGPLTDEQRGRIEALDAARRVLVSKGFASSGEADPSSLVAVAGWIVNGQDPWPEAPPF